MDSLFRIRRAPDPELLDEPDERAGADLPELPDLPCAPVLLPCEPSFLLIEVPLEP